MNNESNFFLDRWNDFLTIGTFLLLAAKFIFDLVKYQNEKKKDIKIKITVYSTINRKKAAEWIKTGDINVTNRSSYPIYIVFYKVFLSLQSSQDNMDKFYSDQTKNVKIESGDTYQIPLIMGDIFQKEIRNGGEVLCRVMVRDSFDLEYWSETLAMHE